MGYCPECEAVIDEEFEDIGEVIVCPGCGVELEVISLDPVEFDLAVIDAEDEDEDEDEEFRFDDSDDEEEWDDESSYDKDEADDEED